MKSRREKKASPSLLLVIRACIWARRSTTRECLERISGKKPAAVITDDLMGGRWSPAAVEAYSPLHKQPFTTGVSLDT